LWLFSPGWFEIPPEIAPVISLAVDARTGTAYAGAFGTPPLFKGTFFEEWDPVPIPTWHASRRQNILACDVARAVSKPRDGDGPHPSAKWRLKCLSCLTTRMPDAMTASGLRAAGASDVVQRGQRQAPKRRHPMHVLVATFPAIPSAVPLKHQVP
jgi:hypothetical protein